jgi:V/A-type H+-transporting ATPase subunit C
MTLAKIKESDYLHSASRVKSIEKHMLTRERAEKMIDAKTMEDAIRVLDDCYYGYLNEITDFENYDNLLIEEHKKTYDFIKSIAPDPEHFNIFLYPYDYHNLKVLMKNEYLNKDETDILVDTGTIDLNVLRHSLKERKFSELTENMGKALNEIIEDFPKNKRSSAHRYCIGPILF